MRVYTPGSVGANHGLWFGLIDSWNSRLLSPILWVKVSAQGIQSTPLNLAVNWRCEPASTDLRIDYKYNTDAMTTAVALNNVQFLVPIDGGVTKLQAVLPPAVW